jgi:MFS family permease
MKARALKLNKTFYYGWLMVFFSAFAFFVSAPGQTYSISVFINIYQKEMQYSSAALSSGYSIATILSGLLLVFMGKATDRFGQRKMLIVVGILLGLTTFYNSYVSNLLMIFIGFFFLRYFGQGSLTLIPNSLIPQWFEEKRAFAISLSNFGGLLATLTVPALNLYLIDTLGWQETWRIWSLILMFGFVPLTALFVINRPEDLGLSMDNKETSSNHAQDLIDLEKNSWTLLQAIKTKEFWFAGLMSIIVPMFTTGVTFHFFSMMELRNISNEHAAMIIGLIAAPAALLPFFAKTIIDRYKLKHVFLLTQIMIFISMLFLALLVNNVASAVVFILFYGLSAGIQGVALNVLWPDYFGRKYLGSIRGAATVFMVIGSALGPLPFGIYYDLTGEYNLVIYGMMGMTLIAMVLASMINKPIKNDF